jgi:hypothetical protein
MDKSVFRRFFTAELKEPASTIGVFEVDTKTPLKDIKKTVEHGRNCTLIAERGRAFIICGAKETHDFSRGIGGKNAYPD